MKKTRKKGIRSLAILLALILAIGFSPVTNVEAKAAPRLNYRKVTLVQGKKKRLKVRNLSRRRRRKVKWYSTRKSVATVNRKGVVKAKRKGKAYIVAKVGRKKYRCRVIVKKKVRRKKKSNKKVKINKSTKRQLPYDTDSVHFRFKYAATLNSVVDLFEYFTNCGDSYVKTSNTVRAKYYRWYSSNTSVLKINKYGIGTAKAVGKSTVYCKYMTSTGKWKKTETAVVKVVDGGNVDFSYSLSTNEIPFNQGTYKVWNYQKRDFYDETLPKFNTLTIKVKNNSSKSIRLDNVVVNTSTVPAAIYFENASQNSVTIQAHSTFTGTYYASYAYSGSLDFRIEKNYIIDKEVFNDLSLFYSYNGTRLKATCGKNSSKWETVRWSYATKDEHYEDEDSIYG